MTVHGHTRNRGQPGLDGDVAAQDAAPVERLGQDEVVDVRRRDAGAVQGLADHGTSEDGGLGVDEGPLEGGPDGGAAGRDDNGVRHGWSSLDGF